jgi:hypothetical protein
MSINLMLIDINYNQNRYCLFDLDSNGELMQESKKKANKAVPSTTSRPKLSIKNPLEEIFISSSYSIQQPYIQVMKEGYDILSKDKSESYSAVRPRSWGKSILARIAGFISLLVILIGCITGGSILLGKQSQLIILLPFASFTLAIVGYVFVSKILSPIRVTKLYMAGSEKKPLFTISPSSGLFIFNRSYHLLDQRGKEVVVYKRPYIQSLLRIRWHAYTPKGKYIFTAIEDSLILALIRRYFGLGRFIPMTFSMSRN